MTNISSAPLWLVRCPMLSMLSWWLWVQPLSNNLRKALGFKDRVSPRWVCSTLCSFGNLSQLNFCMYRFWSHWTPGKITVQIICIQRWQAYGRMLEITWMVGPRSIISMWNCPIFYIQKHTAQRPCSKKALSVKLNMNTKIYFWFHYLTFIYK